MRKLRNGLNKSRAPTKYPFGYGARFCIFAIVIVILVVNNIRIALTNISNDEEVSYFED